MSNAPEIATHVVGAAGAGLGTLWLARMLFARMIKQWDERHKETADKLDEARLKLAVIEASLGDARSLRVDLEGKVAGLRGELETKMTTTGDEVDSLRVDIWVAHERVRMLARGDADFSKIEAPKTIKRR